MKKLLFFGAFLLLNLGFAQTPITQANYLIQAVSSENSGDVIAKAFDNDPATHWAIWGSIDLLPASVEVNLQSSYNVSAFSYSPQPSPGIYRAVGYEVYLSNDGIDWGTAEVIGNFPWIDANDVSEKIINFGTVAAQYVKLIYTSSNDVDNGRILTSNILFYESTTAPTGQVNQAISFEAIPKKYTEDAAFALNATTTSGLPITYSIVSGPASVIGSTLTLSGTGGNVVVKAEQAGDATYYAAEQIQIFEVVDLSTFYPEVSTRLTEDYPIQMSELYGYPIYITTSIKESSVLSIDRVELEIDGNTYEVTNSASGFYYVWTPPENGTYNIDIKAVASNGNEAILNKKIEVSDLVSDQTVRSLDGIVIEFGGLNSRSFTGEYSMPQHIGSYDTIIANLTIECPGGNCDDWDRKAFIDVKDATGNWIQIIRYITPYGVGCKHSIDVTDYSSLLQGNFEWRMFIDTWGTGGWKITLDFDFKEGKPRYLYSKVDEIWDKTWDLGNPSNLQPVDTVNYFYEYNVEASHLRLSNTGHGWGENNSQNAAEFYNATNFINIDNNLYYTQNLWNDCNPNPDGCSPQAGSWRFSRAGWCPGAIAHPDIIDMNAKISPGTSIALTYQFDPKYVDNCHPNNPDCITGTTCPDCNDGYKAVYDIDGQIINFSNSRPLIQELVGGKELDDHVENFNLSVYPSPTNGLFNVFSSNIEGKSRVYIYRISGEVVKTYYFNTQAELNSKVFDLSNEAPGIYFVNIENSKGQGYSKLIVQ